jgi:hypothetical protein
VTLRFLCDENIPTQLAALLAAAGLDATVLGPEARGCTDQAILAIAVAERRILITLDKDFGELAAATALPTGCGVILLRHPLHPLAVALSRIAARIGGRTDWPGHFAVLEPGRTRMRRLPPSLASSKPAKRA